MTDEKAIEKMLYDQQQGWPLCPRCGERMPDKLTHGALSRHAKGVYINNTPQTPTVGELEQKAKAGEPISLIDLANAIHADKERGKEEKPSIRAQLRAAKEQTAQRKAQRSKTQDLERT